MRMICSMHVLLIIIRLYCVERIVHCRPLCAFMAASSVHAVRPNPARQRHRTKRSEPQELGWVFENDLKHVYTQYTQGAASNGSLSRDMAAEPALEACHRGTCQGRHERPARARASARTARHAGRRRPHLAGSRGHLPSVEAGPDAACVHSQGADEQRESREHMEKEGRNRSQIADRAASSKVEAAARGAK